MAFIAGFEWRFGLCVSLFAGDDPHPIHFQPSLCPWRLVLWVVHAGWFQLDLAIVSHRGNHRQGENEVGKLSQSPGFEEPAI